MFTPAQAQVATYLFNDTLQAVESGKPSLTLIDPLGGAGTTGFQTLSVAFGTVPAEVRRVLHLDGTNNSTQNAGLKLNTTGLITSSNTYSVEAVFEFFDNPSSWRKIVDSSNRASDSGFYVSPSNVLDVFPEAGGSTPVANSVFHHVVLTNNGGVEKAYLDGALEFTTGANSAMDISANSLAFFMDDLATSGFEFSDSTVAFLRVYNSVLTDQEVGTLAKTALPAQSAPQGNVPEPGTLAMLVGAAIPAVALAARRRMQ